MIPLVRGTVESHKIPNNEANINTINSVLGIKIKSKNKIALKEYKSASKFFLEARSPK